MNYATTKAQKPQKAGLAQIAGNAANWETQIRSTPVPGVHDTPNQCNALEYLSHVDTLASARPQEKQAMAVENKVQAQAAPHG